MCESVVSGTVAKAARWTWRMSLPMPWGQPPLVHVVEPRHLLSLPLAFTQNQLLTPDEFAKRAKARGVDLRPEHLQELHRRRAVVPLLGIVQRSPKPSTVVPVAPTAADGYGNYRSPIALVVAAAAEGLSVDPGTTSYRAWDGGLPLPTGGRVHRCASVFYSQYQLLALRPAEQLIRTMSGSRAANGKVTLSPDPLTTDEIRSLDGSRQLAILLSALDMRYLPRILLTVHQWNVWEKEDPSFKIGPRLGMLSVWLRNPPAESCSSRAVRAAALPIRRCRQAADAWLGASRTSRHTAVTGAESYDRPGPRTTGHRHATTRLTPKNQFSRKRHHCVTMHRPPSGRAGLLREKAAEVRGSWAVNFPGIVEPKY